MSSVWESASAARRGQAQRRDALRRRMLGLVDATCALAALVIVVEFVSPQPLQVRWTAILLAPVVVVAAKAMGLYDRDEHVLRRTTVDELPGLVNLAALYVLVVWLSEVFVLRGVLMRLEVLSLALISFALFTVARMGVRRLHARITPPERCLIVGNEADAARIHAKLEAMEAIDTVITGRITWESGSSDLPSVVSELATLADADDGDRSLVAEIDAQRAERVILAPDDLDQDEILHLVRLIKALNVKVSVIPRLLEVVGASSTFEDLDGIPVLGLRQFGLSKSSALLKRSMDVVGAAAGLVLLAPLLAMLALAIKLSSPGPVLFRQRRIGRHGEVFTMLKFRSMVPDAEKIRPELKGANEVSGGLFKIADDPRITRIGRFLRHTSLDELPQLLNVLAGHMSLVGPRPLIQDEDAMIEGWERRRLAVRPGMTGMWQIFGASRIPMAEMVKIDYLYGANWSLWGDVKILLRTVPHVAGRRGL